MEKAKLNKIFLKAFDLQEWLVVLKDVFGAKQLLTQPKPILLNNNDRAKSATELGSFATSDDRIIGLYHVVVNDDIWLERNKVGLRELLRNIYRYDVDGALVVFEQGDKWRLSFISEIKVLNDEGEVVEQATEPKRYTYLLGVDEKVKTPSERLSKLAGKTLALNDILNAFSVEALNEEFYKIISEYFYQLVGGTVGSGKSAKSYEPKLKLPIPVENHQTYQEFVVRLIGRTIFCWFLKMKKSDEGISLVPEGLLSSEAVKNNKGYYHTILERLFFQTLNTKMDERVDGLPVGCEKIPFLNGGLFEPNSDDYYKPNRVTGISENLNTLKIEDNWFFELFTELEKYNFTIDENSVTDVEVSVDPEMLGRIFENLLAEIDPDSGETARKATGSFYTPREIVDYMATESIVQYIHNKTSISPDKIRPVFKMTEEPDPTFTKTELEGILDALDKAKILDPACGSGAFPMGVLQKIVQALQKLDANAEWWKKRQVERISNPIVRKALKEKLDSSGVEYARKIGVIQNSLYGVDIQPIAAEISKLRCFLTLIVDENIDETKTNRGIEPLPNLEFKFVTADTLQNLPEEKNLGGLFNSNDDLAQLASIRQDYLQSYGEQKAELKKQFKATQDKIAKQQLGFGAALDVNSRAWLISTWNPFSHDKAEWFEPQWMFGVENFNIVIGNPPYGIVFNKDTKKKYETLHPVFKRNNDIYVAFYSVAKNFLSNGGILTYITPNTFLNGDYFTLLRSYLTNQFELNEFIDFKNSKIFKDPTVFVSISFLTKKPKITFPYSMDLKISNFDFSSVENNIIHISEASDKPIKPIKELIAKIYSNNISSFDNLFYIKDVGFNYWSIGKGKKRDGDSIGDRILYCGDRISILDKPYLKGRDIEKYGTKEPSNYLRNDYKSFLTEGVDVFRFSSEILETVPKIVYRQTSSSIIAALDYNARLTDKTVHVIIPKEQGKKYDLRFLLCLLNSSLFNYLYIDISQETEGRAFAQVKTTYIKKLPLIVKGNMNQNPFICLADYCRVLTELDKKKTINDYVPNSHIVQLFEEVIDALVYELYFEEDFTKAGIEFMKYAQRYFKSIEDKAEKEAVAIIHQAYQTLREKNNEIRQNLKLMDTRLADLIMPIKTAK